MNINELKADARLGWIATHKDGREGTLVTLARVYVDVIMVEGMSQEQWLWRDIESITEPKPKCPERFENGGWVFTHDGSINYVAAQHLRTLRDLISQGRVRETEAEAINDRDRERLETEILKRIRVLNRENGWEYVRGAEYCIIRTRVTTNNQYGTHLDHHDDYMIDKPQWRMCEETAEQILKEYSAEQLHFAKTGERL